MEKINKKPVFLNLFIIKLPVTAVLSILHRLSGVVMVCAIPWLLYYFDQSLQSESGFTQTQQQLSSFPLKIISIFALWLLCHHFLAGIRFLLMDFDIGLQRKSARLSAWWVNLLAVFITLIVGGLWLV